MPSYAMHLAIAKKYLENHKEENEEEFYEGTIAPDMKPVLEVGNGRLHYGENSHKPGLNRYYQEEGLNSSYNRGYFLHLLTDYLFYNKFLNEYSHDIYDDYQRMNKRIIDKYELHIPEKVKPHINIIDEDIKVIDEESVYKFIDTVGKLDLEQYKEQVKEQDKEHQIKLVGLKEGLLYKQKGSSPLNQLNEAYFYGFENNYGVLIQRIIGYAETDGAREGLYQVSPVGIAVKPSKIMGLNGPDIASIRERLTPEEREIVYEECEEELGKTIRKDIGFNFQEMSKEDIKILLKTIKDLPERTPQKEVTENSLNSDLITEEDIEIR